MSEIFFIRHAETDMTGTFCGHSNPKLNARGRAQLSALVRGLRREDIHEVYASDLLRAQETGQAIASSLAISCQLRPALREINFGRWEGLRWEEIEQRDSAYAQLWLAEYPDLPAPDGERFEQFERRVLDEVAFLVEKAEGLTIAVVTHAGVLRTVLRALHGCSEDEALQQTKSYCSLVRYKTPEMPSMRFAAVRS
jgi:alpha-ribazole phosphatase